MPQASNQAFATGSNTLPPALSREFTTGGGDPGALEGREAGAGGRASREALRLSGKEGIRQAVLLSFCDPLPERALELQSLSLKEWTRLLRWLDFSGLALQFFDRILELNLGHMLPAAVLLRLQQSLADNSVRTQGMIAESIAIQREFQGRLLRYSILKGLSLWPSSIRRPELRSQFDLDFLVAEDDLADAHEVLVRRGYRLYQSRETCWEYKINERPGLTLKDLYKHTGSWIVELHIDTTSDSTAAVLDRVKWRDFDGFNMPVLSPVDLFLRQGLHAYKHVCSQFARAAFLVEFRRHVLFHASDEKFWYELRAEAMENPRARLALGVITLLISRVMGPFAPDLLTDWTVHTLPGPARLWVELYGHRAATASYPGSKLYLLLQTQPKMADARLDRPLWQFLVPLRLPPPAILAFPNETIAVRLARYRMRAGILFGRLRFCIVEGLRFAWEFRRWRRHLRRNA